MNRKKLCPPCLAIILRLVEEGRLTILGSGSSGNAVYLETPDTRLLVDCGFSARQIRQRLATIGRAPENLNGILITHEHSDHIQGLKNVAGKLNLPLYCNRHTSEEITRLLPIDFDFRLFETGQTFDLGDVAVETFSVPHDAADPVGFLLHTAAGQIGVLTDLGHAPRPVADRMRNVNILLLETNHDLQLLRDCPRRPPALKQRITSRHGHLSNEGAADFAGQVVHPGLSHIYCTHLSHECNTPALARAELADVLGRLGATHVEIHITQQATPSPTLVLPPQLSSQKTLAPLPASL